MRVINPALLNHFSIKISIQNLIILQVLKELRKMDLTIIFRCGCIVKFLDLCRFTVMFVKLSNLIKKSVIIKYSPNTYYIKKTISIFILKHLLVKNILTQLSCPEIAFSRLLFR